MAHQEIKVEGMTCGHCAETVTRAVRSLEGIDQVEVQLENKKVTVDFDEGRTSVEAISSKIKEVGFDVVG